MPAPGRGRPGGEGGGLPRGGGDVQAPAHEEPAITGRDFVDEAKAQAALSMSASCAVLPYGVEGPAILQHLPERLRCPGLVARFVIALPRAAPGAVHPRGQQEPRAPGAGVLRADGRPRAPPSPSCSRACPPWRSCTSAATPWGTPARRPSWEPPAARSSRCTWAASA